MLEMSEKPKSTYVTTLVEQNHETLSDSQATRLKLFIGNSELLHRLKTNRQETLEAWGISHHLLPDRQVRLLSEEESKDSKRSFIDVN